MGKDTKTIPIGQLCQKLCGKIVKTAEKGNLATMLYKIWQPCSLETFLNVTIRFPSTKNMGKDTKTISVGQLCPKLCGKIVKTAEKRQSGNPVVQNLATLFIGNISKCHHSMPQYRKHGKRHQNQICRSIMSKVMWKNSKKRRKRQSCCTKSGNPVNWKHF